MSEPEPIELQGRKPEDIFSLEGYPPSSLPQAADGLHELGLAVTLHPGDPEDLPGVDLEGHALHGFGTPVGGDAEVPHHEGRLATWTPLFPLFPGQLGAELHRSAPPDPDLLPHHHPGKLLGRCFPGLHLPHHFPATEHRDPVGDLQDLPELVGDEDDPHALPFEAAKEPEELVGLHRGEDRGGLVQDEDPHLPGKHLQDLHPLSLSHGQVLDGDIQGDLEAGALHEFHHRTSQLAAQREPRTQGDVLQGGEGIHQGEVLVDHADAPLQGVPGGAEPNGFPPDEDPPRGGVEEAGDDLGEGGLPGAVFAQKALYLPGADLEIDALQGHRSIGINLYDPLGTKKWLGHRRILNEKGGGT